jgi:hypothetical protein
MHLMSGMHPSVYASQVPGFAGKELPEGVPTEEVSLCVYARSNVYIHLSWHLSSSRSLLVFCGIPVQTRDIKSRAGVCKGLSKTHKPS